MFQSCVLLIHRSEPVDKTYFTCKTQGSNDCYEPMIVSSMNLDHLILKHNRDLKKKSCKLDSPGETCSNDGEC